MDSKPLLVPFLIGAAMSVCWAATDIFLPSLPGISTYFETSTDATQMALPAYLVGSVCSTPFFGVYADGYGRRPVLLFGLSIFVLGSLFCALAPTLNCLILSRFIQGAGGSAAFVVGWALINDLYPGAQGAKMMSWMAMTFTTVPLIAPSIGGYIEVWLGWRANFALIFLAGAFTTSLVAFLLVTPGAPPPRRKVSFAQGLRNYREIITNRTFVCFILIFAVLCAGEWVYLTIAPFYFEDVLKYTPERFGVMLSLIGLAYMIGTMLTPFSIDRLGLNTTIGVGIALCFLGALSLGIAYVFAPASGLLICLSIILYLGGMSFVFGPASSMALQQFEHSRASASAVRTVLVTSFCSLGGVMGSVVNDLTLLPLTIAMLICTAFALLLLGLARNHVAA